MGISLWLVPPRDTAAKLRRVMDMKTPTAKSPSSFPSFEPHITLCTVPSSSSIPTLVSAIPADQVIVPVIFKSVEVGNKYFMSVYVTVHHESELNTLRAALAERLGESAVPPVSHVSLFYIDDADMDERTKIEKELRNSSRIIPLGEDHVALDCSEEPSGNLTSKEDFVSGFVGAEIWVAVCDGPVPGWEIKDRIPLRRS